MMLFNKKFDFIVGIGEDCACSTYLRKFNLQNRSYPFDWLTKAPFSNRINLILNDFQNFMNKENLHRIEIKDVITDTNCDYYEDIETELYFYHDFAKNTPFEISYPLVKAKYDRRISRFYEQIKKSENILFVWWSRD